MASLLITADAPAGQTASLPRDHKIALLRARAIELELQAFPPAGSQILLSTT